MAQKDRCVLLYSEQYEKLEPRLVARVREAIEREGFEVVDWKGGLQIDEGGLVVAGITESIRSAQRAVTILNKGRDGFSENVLYELGYCHATLSPIRVVSVIDRRRVEGSPFNIQGFQHVMVDRGDLEALERDLRAELRSANEFDDVRSWQEEADSALEQARSRIAKIQRECGDPLVDPEGVLGRARSALTRIQDAAKLAARQRRDPGNTLSDFATKLRAYLEGCTWLVEVGAKSKQRIAGLDAAAQSHFLQRVKEALDRAVEDTLSELGQAASSSEGRSIDEVLLRAGAVAAAHRSARFCGALCAMGALLGVLLWLPVGIGHEAWLAYDQGAEYAVDLFGWLPKICAFAITALFAGYARSRRWLSPGFAVSAALGVFLAVSIASSELNYKGPQIPLFSPVPEVLAQSSAVPAGAGGAAPAAAAGVADPVGAPDTGASEEPPATPEAAEVRVPPGEPGADAEPVESRPLITNDEVIRIASAQGAIQMGRRSMNFLVLFAALVWWIPRRDRDPECPRWNAALWRAGVLGVAFLGVGALDIALKIDPDATPSLLFRAGELADLARWRPVGVRVVMGTATFLSVWWVYHAPWRLARVLSVPGPTAGA